MAGFGGALVSMPLILLYAEPKWAAPVVVLCYTINRASAMFVLRKDLMWDHSLLLIAAAIPGALLGGLLLKSMEPGLIMKIMGTVLILFSTYKIIAPEFKLAFSRIWAVPAGLLSGILGAAVGTDGPPVVVYAALKPWSKEQVVGMLQSFFVFTNFIVLGSYWVHGLLTTSVLKASGVAAPFAVVGILLALKINKRMSQRRFEVILSIVIGLMGFLLWMR
ncbi:MAG: hypothetical protein A2170_05490 [Deltaproteobacteria bacterium RBG_13_53_10]|nr:MAG: hypothetical protein A2170_05490 [Deltaproteobacteria bacterium RBG_13_53_10]